MPLICFFLISCGMWNLRDKKNTYLDMLAPFQVRSHWLIFPPLNLAESGGGGGGRNESEAPPPALYVLGGFGFRVGPGVRSKVAPHVGAMDVIKHH